MVAGWGWFGRESRQLRSSPPGRVRGGWGRALAALGLWWLTANLGAAAPLAITTQTLAPGVAGVAYKQTLAATGGKTPYTWSLTAGNLPTGLTLNPTNGVLAGTTAVSNQVALTVQVRDATNGHAAVALTLTVAPPPVVTHALTVVKGTGGGAFPTNTVVPITAAAAPAGQAFSRWTGFAVANPAAPATTLAMPNYAVTVTATYTNLPPHYTLTVVNGSGGGSYLAKTVVALQANPASAGQAFSQWTGAAVANGKAPSTTLAMPAANTTVTANYTNLPKYTLVVTGGAGGGAYLAGTPVTITANPAPAGKIFTGWTGAVVGNAGAATTTLVMPAVKTTVTANYGAAGLPLAITTTGLPPATAGASYAVNLHAAGGVPPYRWVVTAGSFPAGLNLATNGLLAGTPTATADWELNYPYDAYVTVTDAASNAYAAGFSFALKPPTNWVFTLTVVNGSGGGNYLTDTAVGITANPPAAGFAFVGWTGALVANPAAAGTTLVMPAANTTVTANFTSVTNLPPTYTLTVNNGTGGGVYPANATVPLSAAAPGAGLVFQNWTGAAVANPGAADTTLVMPAANATVTANFRFPPPTITNVPLPVAAHPRLWLTPADLPRLQSWATPANPIYGQGWAPLLAQAAAVYDTQFFPGGVANPVYPDLGDAQGYVGQLSEQYALIFAFQSLIDPVPANRILNAQRARNLIMHALAQTALGPLANAPFRDPAFPVYNRAGLSSEAWPLVVDWIYNATNSQGQPILTAADKLTVRNAFLTWATACLNASTTGGDHPEPVGAVNDPALLPGGDAYRMAANNYYISHARLLTLISLALDPADDPVLDPAKVPAQLGNTLRSYILDATGAWLYQEFAMFGDHDAVCAAYNLPATASVGMASGGLPPEGMLYGESFAAVFGQLLALKTAGFADPALAGPQAALINNPPVWDRFVRGFISSLVPVQITSASEPWLGEVYQFASYGDVLESYSTPDLMCPFALLSLLDRQNGDLSRQNAERWFAINGVEGGAPSLIERVANPWTWGVQDALFAFLLLDPAAVTTPPQPGYPTAFYDAPAGRLVDRTDWSTNATLFDFRCSWESINHQQADGNQFEFFRRGEWLTKGVANYDNNLNGITTDYHNTLSLQNWCANGVPHNLDWDQGPFWTNGSQWQLGGGAGDPHAFVGAQPGYDYAFGDTTPLYNRPSPNSPADAGLDILHASRSILWLKPDQIVVYDRATSAHAGLFKHFNLAVPAPPVAHGNVITTTTPRGQHLTLTALLPVNAQLTVVPIGNALNPIADLEPSTHRIILADPVNAADTRFLNVLQGTDAGVAPEVATAFASHQGNAMEGAWFGASAVLFQVDPYAAFTGSAYSVPAGVVNHFITGLSPGAHYQVTAQIVAGGVNVTLAPAAAGYAADPAGVLTLAF